MCPPIHRPTWNESNRQVDRKQHDHLRDIHSESATSNDQRAHQSKDGTARANRRRSQRREAIRRDRAAKAGQRGARNPNDPFYWRFLEFGTRKMPARPFLQRATSALPKALTIFQERVAKWINETNRSGQVNP